MKIIKNKITIIMVILFFLSNSVFSQSNLINNVKTTSGRNVSVLEMKNIDNKAQQMIEQKKMTRNIKMQSQGTTPTDSVIDQNLLSDVGKMKDGEYTTATPITIDEVANAIEVKLDYRPIGDAQCEGKVFVKAASLYNWQCRVLSTFM